MSGRGMDQFRQWLKKNDVTEAHLWVESTGRYHEPLAEWAIERGWKVTVANPRCVRHFATAKLKLAKTDKLDAKVVLRFAESATSEEIVFWSPKSPACKALRDIHLELSGLKKLIGQEQNRLRCGLTNIAVKVRIRQTIKFLQAQQKALLAEAIRVIKADPELSKARKLLLTIKGIGDATIIVLLAKIDFELFRKGRQLVKFAGLDALPWQSGKTNRQRGISRAGHADLRSALYLPAIVSMTHDANSKAFAKRLEASGCAKKEIICAIMSRLLRVAFAVVRDGESYVAK
jgi:transposase